MKTALSKILSAAIVLVSLTGGAEELNPEDGLKRLSQNIETSTKNRDEYNKVIEQVSHNIITLDSASVELQGQKRKLLQQISENKNTLTLHSKKLQELDRSRQEEERKKLEEQNKITQLESTLTQLKELQKSRQERIQKLAQDRVEIEKSQKNGEVLQTTLAGEVKEVDQRIDALKKEITPWKAKKKSYEKEAARWGNEIDRHQKMEAEVKLLMDSAT